MNWVNRLRNYGFWISSASLILLLLKGVGLDIMDNQYHTVVDFILATLVLLGIINNPTTTHRGYLDDQKNNVPLK
jgi:uncharacterized membrane protein